ncbi:MAG: hypothetical protein JWP21_552 [Tardiphaga sp.]|jgi:hypothetical protein|nr:hypothetical protein [Tardiphaga sp.]MDB5573669.1 hypothetical protein [Tardiphaga sp.]MDB5629467.1 hypothetical protein [Tardiphaga sp.]
MTTTAQPQPIRSAATPADARTVAATLLDAMTALLAVIERETELVRAGNVRDAMKMEPQKSELSRRYAMAVMLFKASQPYMATTTPDLLKALHQHHNVFRGMLQINLTVLATSHAVTEGVVRGVNAEVQRRNVPQTYNAYGLRNQPGPRNMTPIALSRSL